jgi:uncharacterized membrane protein YgdD (TMEM256/DUF423 family)
MQRIWFSAAGLCGALAVGLAAIAAHVALDSRAMVQSVAMLLGWHAPAFIGLGLWGRGGLVAAVLLTGLTLFSGAVLIRAFLGVSLGPVAPIGGMTMIAGWLLLAVLAWRR